MEKSGRKPSLVPQYQHQQQQCQQLQQSTSPRTAASVRKLVPIASFCMSGPVAHVDDEEEEDEEFYVMGGERSCKNGDIYSGSCLENLPDGTGKYLWADGCMYEGEWCKGKNTGKGRVSWPSGATYEGDFKAGYMHGFGIYTGVDGSTYKGYWEKNEKHGHGRKYYANGDFYEGFWKHGVQEGQGRYVWDNGNEYAGEWRGGLMCGKGTLTWANGNKYEGEWLDGCEHGEGVYTWADGSYYVGTWNKDNKDGNRNGATNGTFYPAPNAALPLLQTRTLQVPASCLNNKSFVAQNSSKPNKASPRKSYKQRQSVVLKPFESICVWDSDENSINIDYKVKLPPRPRKSGAMVLDNAEISLVPRKIASPNDPDERFWGFKSPKDVKRPGDPVLKGHRNYELMLSLQLGIRYTVGRITPEPSREICSSDFGSKAHICMRFPPEGSTYTPPHQSMDFKWKDFCPLVFRHLRELSKIDAAEYMLSICGNDALRELSSPGKSGCVFYLTHDDRFLIKTIRKSEVKVLLALLPSYYNHVRSYENTLITRFFGLHSIKMAGGQKVSNEIRFIVMGNMLCTPLPIHRRYDLKGSSHGRSTDKVEIDETTTLKDLDLDFVFRLDSFWFQCLIRQIEYDCEFLESQKIMDYSLILGLHFQAPQASKAQPTEHCSVSCNDQVYREENLNELGCSQKRTQDDSVRSTMPTSKQEIQQLGFSTPAKAERRLSSNMSDCFPEGEYFGEVYDVLLHFGIIDILQDYDISKRLEHAYKSLQFDSLSISAVDPKLYSKRFRDFVSRVFVEAP